MLALQTFQFRVMHIVLLNSCISYLIIDKIAEGVLKLVGGRIDQEPTNDPQIEQRKSNIEVLH